MAADITPVDLALQLKAAPGSYAPHQVVGRPRSRALSARAQNVAPAASAKAATSAAMPQTGLNVSRLFARLVATGATGIASAAGAAILAGGIVSAGSLSLAASKPPIARVATPTHPFPAAAKALPAGASTAQPAAREAHQPANQHAGVAVREPSTLALLGLGDTTSQSARLARLRR